MLGQPISLTLPHVIGYKITGTPHELCTSTDLVLAITKVKHKVYSLPILIAFLSLSCHTH